MDIEESRAMPVAEMASSGFGPRMRTCGSIRCRRSLALGYKTSLMWVKDRMGTGEWLRGKTVARCTPRATPGSCAAHRSDSEPAHVQTLVTQVSVKTFDVCTLRGLAGLNMNRVDLVFNAPR